MRNDAVQAVVAALQIDEHQHAIVPAGQLRQRRVRESAPEDVVEICHDRHSRERTEEKATTFHLHVIPVGRRASPW